jgi:hypothetical protein
VKILTNLNSATAAEANTQINKYFYQSPQLKERLLNYKIMVILHPIPEDPKTRKKRKQSKIFSALGSSAAEPRFYVKEISLIRAPKAVENSAKATLSF